MCPEPLQQIHGDYFTWDVCNVFGVSCRSYYITTKRGIVTAPIAPVFLYTLHCGKEKGHDILLAEYTLNNRNRRSLRYSIPTKDSTEKECGWYTAYVDWRSRRSIEQTNKHRLEKNIYSRIKFKDTERKQGDFHFSAFLIFIYIERWKALKNELMGYPTPPIATAGVLVPSCTLLFSRNPIRFVFPCDAFFLFILRWVCQ